MWAFGCHFHIKTIDTKRQTCDSGVGCIFQEGEGIVDYIVILKEIIEVDFRSLAKEIVFKVCWLKSKVEWNNYLFPSIDGT
jgi:hypothetical protein